MKYIKFNNEELFIQQATYPNGKVAYELLTRKTFERYGVLSVNLDTPNLEGYFWLKTWSENQKMAEFLAANGYLAASGRACTSGYAVAIEVKS